MSLKILRLLIISCFSDVAGASTTLQLLSNVILGQHRQTQPLQTIQKRIFAYFRKHTDDSTTESLKKVALVK